MASPSHPSSAAMHRYNRSAFFNVDTSSALLRLYARLVALELALKDIDPNNRPLGHDVFQMIQLRGDAALSSTAMNLNQALTRLKCTNRMGTSAPIAPAKYPDIRYLRHASDFPGETPDSALETAMQALDLLVEEMKRTGIKPC